MKQDKIKSIGIEWLESNVRSNIPIEDYSTQFPFDLIDINLGLIPEFDNKEYDVRVVLMFILRFATEKRYYKVKKSTDVFSHRFYAACISLCGLDLVANTESLRAFCRVSNLDYFYLRRCVISFKLFTKTNKP
jgi:hypothetical protein